jgi:hypothetical protein
MKWVALCVLFFVGVLILTIREDEKEDVEWRNYVAQHHCYYATYGQSTFRMPLWSCDGFQIRHQ